MEAAEADAAAEAVDAAAVAAAEAAVVAADDATNNSPSYLQLPKYVVTRQGFRINRQQGGVSTMAADSS